MHTKYLNMSLQLAGNRSSVDEPRDAEQEETVVEPDQNNGRTSFFPLRVLRNVQLLTMTVVLSHIIAQLRPGADLSRITLPTFILEERSMLERITKYVVIP